jgi:hypothetical protein
MREHSLNIQESIHFVGNLLKRTIDEFHADKARLPRWGAPEIDDRVDAYVRGMEYWVVGSFEWSFSSERYFGTEFEEVRRTRTVTVWKKAEEGGAGVHGAALAGPSTQAMA